jgi:hypothetical protein
VHFQGGGAEVVFSGGGLRLDGVEGAESSMLALEFGEIFVALGNHGGGAVDYGVDLDAAAVGNVMEAGG